VKDKSGKIAVKKNGGFLYRFLYRFFTAHRIKRGLA
jgi:hypothetical protein